MTDEQNSTVEGRTPGERIAFAMARRGIKSPAALARILKRDCDFDVTRQTIANIVADRVVSPRQELLEAIASVVGLTVEEIRHGPRSEDTLFLAQMRGLQGDLTDSQQDQLLYLANRMAEETRLAREAEARRRAEAALSEDERELLEAFRAAAPAQRRDALAVMLSQPTEGPGRRNKRPAAQARRPRKSA